MLEIEFKMLPHLEDRDFQQITRLFQQIGCKSSVSRYRPTGALARYDWLLPCGVTMEVKQPFYETQVSSAHEQFVAPLKQLLAEQLYDKAMRSENPFKLMAKNGTEKNTIFTMHFCVSYELSWKGEGIKLKLMFPKNCNRQEFRDSILAYMQMLEDIYLANSTETFFTMLKNADGQGYGTRVLWFNTDTGKPEFIDVESSHKKSTIIRKKIC